MKHLKHVLLIGALVSLASCESSTTPPVGSSSNLTVGPNDRALFIASEGIHSGTSSLDVVIYRQNGDVVRDSDILTGLGEANDVAISGNRVYVLDNGKSAINVLNADSVKPISTIQLGSSAPNKMALIDGNRAIVTSRAENHADIVDLTSGQITETIELGESSVEVVVMANKAYITGEGGSSNDLFIYDIPSRIIVSRIALLDAPEMAVADAGHSTILIGSFGVWGTTPGRVYWLSTVTGQLVDSVNMTDPSGGFSIAGGVGKQFLFANDTVWQFDNVAHKLAKSFVTPGQVYYKGYYDAVKDELYLGHASFSGADETVDVYDPNSGTKKRSILAGIAPAHFAFYH